MSQKLIKIKEYSRLFIFETGSLYGPGCPGTHCMVQVDFQLTESLLPLPLSVRLKAYATTPDSIKYFWEE